MPWPGKSQSLPGKVDPIHQYASAEPEIADILYAAGQEPHISACPPQVAPRFNSTVTDIFGGQGRINQKDGAGPGCELSEVPSANNLPLHIPEVEARTRNSTRLNNEVALGVDAEASNLEEWLVGYKSSGFRPSHSRWAYAATSQALDEPPPKAPASTTSRAGSSQSAKRIRQLQGLARSDSEEEKRSLEAKKQRASGTTGSKQSFVCPIYQRDPSKHQKFPSCKGEALTTAHRVKQHLYRCHERPSHRCATCQKTFRHRADLDKHYRSENASQCPPSESVPVEGIITKEQKDALTKRSRKGQEEEEKWKDIYRILFPDDKQIPSPYAEPEPRHYQVPPSVSGLSIESSHILEDFEDFFSLETLPHLSRRLRQMNKHNGLGLDSRQMSAIEVLLQKVTTETFETFKHRQENLSLDRQPEKGNFPNRASFKHQRSTSNGGSIAGSSTGVAGSSTAQSRGSGRSFSFGTPYTAPTTSISTSSPPGQHRKTGNSLDNASELLQTVPAQDFDYDPVANTINPAALLVPDATSFDAASQHDCLESTSELIKYQRVRSQDPEHSISEDLHKPVDSLTNYNNEIDFVGVSPWNQQYTTEKEEYVVTYAH